MHRWLCQSAPGKRLTSGSGVSKEGPFSPLKSPATSRSALVGPSSGLPFNPAAGGRRDRPGDEARLFSNAKENLYETPLTASPRRQTIGGVLSTTNAQTEMPHPVRPSMKSRLPQNSFLFEKLVPALMIGLGLVTIVLILFAAGVLLGLIQF